MESCAYLGHVVGNGEVHPEKSKLEAVRKFPTPVTQKQVQAFLGLTGYYKKLIFSYAEIAAPLTDLTRKNVPNKIDWTVDCEKAFLSQGQRVVRTPIEELGLRARLHSPDGCLCAGYRRRTQPM